MKTKELPYHLISTTSHPSPGRNKMFFLTGSGFISTKRSSALNRNTQHGQRHMIYTNCLCSLNSRSAIRRSDYGIAFTAAFVSALEREYEISTVYRIFATVANFVKFLILHEIIKPVDNPTDGIRLQDQELPPPKGVQLIATGRAKAFYLSSAKMYDLLMSAAQYFIKKKDPKNKRDRTMPYRDAAIVAYSTILVFVLKRSAVSHCPRWI